MMGTVELSETEMLEMRYRSLDITREPFMYHWTWSGGGYDITCTVRVVPPGPHCCVNSLIGIRTSPTSNTNRFFFFFCMSSQLCLHIQHQMELTWFSCQSQFPLSPN